MTGGGVKGLVYVGAFEVLQEHYSFNRYVGTLAGSITALLLAAGYTTEELRQILAIGGSQRVLSLRLLGFGIPAPEGHGRRL
jgi:NTE family protein